MADKTEFREDENRCVFFMQRTVKENGEYVVCIAEEGTPGFYKTDWLWGTDFALATKLCDERNEKNGISKEEAEEIIVGTIFPKRA